MSEEYCSALCGSRCADVLIASWQEYSHAYESMGLTHRYSLHYSNLHNNASQSVSSSSSCVIPGGAGSWCGGGRGSQHTMLHHWDSCPRWGGAVCCPRSYRLASPPSAVGRRDKEYHMFRSSWRCDNYTILICSDHLRFKKAHMLNDRIKCQSIAITIGFC